MKCNDTLYVQENYVMDKAQTYLKLCDFDDHFADIANCDWRNPDIQTQDWENYAKWWNRKKYLITWIKTH